MLLAVLETWFWCQTPCLLVWGISSEHLQKPQIGLKVIDTCNCKKMDVRGNKCTALSCRNCECYDRTKDGPETPPASSTDSSSTDSEEQSEPMINYERDQLDSLGSSDDEL